MALHPARAGPGPVRGAGPRAPARAGHFGQKKCFFFQEVCQNSKLVENVWLFFPEMCQNLKLVKKCFFFPEVYISFFRTNKIFFCKAQDNCKQCFFLVSCFVPFHSISLHSIPFHSIPFHYIPFHSIAFHSIPFNSILFHSILGFVPIVWVFCFVL